MVIGKTSAGCRWFAGLAWLIGWMAAGTAAHAESIRWEFDSASEVVAKVNIEPGHVAQGRLAGETAWDPYVSLRMPSGGIDARKFTWLTVRLYSSEKADLLDVYYQSPDKRWCLGGRFPVARGWATYRMDLTQNKWRETATGDTSRQWGGPSKRVSSLRIDPGNQAHRWIAFDYVELQTTEPGFKEGIVVEPMGTSRQTAANVPRAVDAGKPIAFSYQFEIELPPGLTTGTTFVRLCHGATVMRSIEQTVALSGKTLKIEGELPTSAYWNPSLTTIEAGCYELARVENGAQAKAKLQLDNPRLDTVKPPVVELQRLGGEPAIFVNGKPLPGTFYVSSGGLHLDYHREMARAGIHLYADWFGASNHSDMGHVAQDRYDYAEFDRYFAAILDVDPQAYFLPHIGITGPLWWQKAHPEEMCQFEDGSKGPTSFASEVWRRDMGEDLRKLIAYLRKSPYADRIIGYAFYNGHTAEWQMWGTWKTSRDDYSEPALRAFRAFLQRRYENDDRLRTAWGDATVTLATASMPGESARRPGGPEVLRDPKTERQAIDFYEFISNMDADALLDFARIVREATAGKALVGTYYAYLTAHGINQQDSGHLAAQRVFDSPDIDFLMSPPNYCYRRPGEACTFMSATDSMRLRGKLWLDESDHRTHLTDLAAGCGRANTLDESLGVFWREFAEVLTKRAAVSWFDMGGGWFSDPKILADMGQSQRIAIEALAARKPFTAEIGVFVDPESFYRMRPTTANSSLCLQQVVTMPQSGAPWDFCLLSDIADPRLPDYKLYIFLNAFYVDPARRQAIVTKLKRNGATALFVYAPGYCTPEGNSLEAIQALTGIRIAQSDTEGKPQIVLEAGDPLSLGCSPGVALGSKRMTVKPVFYADDPDSRVAARLVGSNHAGLVVKKLDGWTSIYSAAMELPPVLMRNIARSAGVHVWIETDDALYADSQFVGVHAATAGRKLVRLPTPCSVVDSITGQPVSTTPDGRTVSVDLRRTQTTLLRLTPRQ